MRSVLIALPVLAALAACQPAPAKGPAKPAATTPANPAADIPPGAYKIDPEHTTVLFRVDHIGMSKFTAQFRRFDATLTLDPKTPENSSLVAEIDTASLDTKTSPALAFDKMITGPDWLGAEAHPKITYRSRSIEKTGPDTARIIGELTLKGVTKPVVLEAKYNGGYAPNGMDPSGSRIGFSATGSFKRSEFGISAGIPAPGSKMGVSDEVEVIIETEFTQPKQG
ncbi:MAG TPA: YceI family protein [Caulobacter sp.]|nr:YceI family protein [Caulobacter sp.]